MPANVELYRGDRKTRAFTLVELLVVVGIVVLLIAILLPALNKARFYSGQLACLSNVRQLSMGVQMYASENKGGLPRFRASHSASNSIPGTSSKWPHDWTYLIYPYIGQSPAVFLCPLRVWRTTLTATMTAPDGTTAPGLISYRVNGAVIFNEGQVSFTTANPQNFIDSGRPFGPIYLSQGGGVFQDNEDTMKISTVASDTIMLTDSVHGNVPGSNGEASASYYGVCYYAAITSVALSAHYNKSASFAFFDGHCETIETDALLKMKDKNGNTLVKTPLTTDVSQGLAGDADVNFYNSSTSTPRGAWSGAAND